MALVFQRLPRRRGFPAQAHNLAYLQPDNWDDFGHKTLFSLIVYDEKGAEQIIGDVKIGFVGQGEGWTEEEMPLQFYMLPENFYSLGQDADYYQNLIEKLSEDIAVNVLKALGDVAFNSERLAIADGQAAFNSSVMRSVDRVTIEEQFRRILRKEAPLTEYDFFYEKTANDRYSGLKVDFKVEPNSKPSSNIHILIGRNGVGKTTLLNSMVSALLTGIGLMDAAGYFATVSKMFGPKDLKNDYFAGVVSVSFSAFDPFIPPEEQHDARLGMRYYYVGLKKRLLHMEHERWGLKNRNDLCLDFSNSLKLCLSLTAKRERWVKAVRKLESDHNFAEMDLCRLTNMHAADLSDNKVQFSQSVSALFDNMSSGHAIVLLTITKLVETVEEKTLVLIDEPESHLHPPLLSAFTRALSDLLVNRNGVAIIATHSPVVLQEVPKSCVSIIRRTRLISNVDRPENETFAENVGILTREVFGLEVSKSGFHDLLASSVVQGKSFEEIEQEYKYQLGFEGRAVLRSMIFLRDSQMDAEE